MKEQPYINLRPEGLRKIVEKAEYARAAIYGRHYMVGVCADRKETPYDGNHFYLIPFDEKEKQFWSSDRIYFHFEHSIPKVDEWSRITLMDTKHYKWTITLYSRLVIEQTDLFKYQPRESFV